MLFNFPSFIGKKEQTKSEILFNNIKILIQTQIKELWADVNFGTDIRNNLKQGINSITVFNIRNEIEEKLQEYFSNDINLQSISTKQNKEEPTKLEIDVTYIELRTGINYTLHTEENIENIYYQ